MTQEVSKQEEQPSDQPSKPSNTPPHQQTDKETLPNPNHHVSPIAPPELPNQPTSDPTSNPPTKADTENKPDEVQSNLTNNPTVIPTTQSITNTNIQQSSQVEIPSDNASKSTKSKPTVDIDPSKEVDPESDPQSIPQSSPPRIRFNQSRHELTSSRPVQSDIPDRDPHTFMADENKSIGIDLSENGDESDGHVVPQSEPYDVDEDVDEADEADEADEGNVEERTYVHTESEVEPHMMSNGSSSSPTPVPQEPIDLTTPERSEHAPENDQDPLPLQQTQHDDDSDHDEDRDDDEQDLQKNNNNTATTTQHVREPQSPEAKVIIDLEDGDDEDEDDVGHDDMEDRDEEQEDEPREHPDQHDTNIEDNEDEDDRKDIVSDISVVNKDKEVETGNNMKTEMEQPAPKPTPIEEKTKPDLLDPVKTVESMDVDTTMKEEQLPNSEPFNNDGATEQEGEPTEVVKKDQVEDTMDIVQQQDTKQDEKADTQMEQKQDNAVDSDPPVPSESPTLVKDDVIASHSEDAPKAQVDSMEDQKQEKETENAVQSKSGIELKDLNQQVDKTTDMEFIKPEQKEDNEPMKDVENPQSTTNDEITTPTKPSVDLTTFDAGQEKNKESTITAPMFGVPAKPNSGGMVSFLSRPTFQRSSLSPTAPAFIPISQQIQRDSEPIQALENVEKPKETEEIKSAKTLLHIAKEAVVSATPPKSNVDEPVTQEAKIQPEDETLIKPTEEHPSAMEVEKSDTKEDAEIEDQALLEPTGPVVEEKKGTHKIRRYQTSEGPCLEISNVSVSSRNEGTGKTRKRSHRSVLRMIDVKGVGGRMVLMEDKNGTLSIWEELRAQEQNFRLTRAKNRDVIVVTFQKEGAGNTNVIQSRHFLTFNLPNFKEINSEVARVMLKKKADTRTKKPISPTKEETKNKMDDSKEESRADLASKKRTKLAAEKALLLQKLAAHRKKQKVDVPNTSTQEMGGAKSSAQTPERIQGYEEKRTIVPATAPKQPTQSLIGHAANQKFVGTPMPSKVGQLTPGAQSSSYPRNDMKETVGSSMKRPAVDNARLTSQEGNKKARPNMVNPSNGRPPMALRSGKSVTFSGSALKSGRVVGTVPAVDRRPVGTTPGRLREWREAAEAKAKQAADARETQVRRIRESTRSELLAEVQREKEAVEEEFRKARELADENARKEAARNAALAGQVKRVRTLMLMLKRRTRQTLEDKERLRRCDPTSAEDQAARVRTFSPNTWIGFADVGVIDPATCARHGWHNSAPGLLRSSDGAELKLETTDASIYAEASHKLKAKLLSGHALLSPWTGKSYEQSIRVNADVVKANEESLQKAAIFDKDMEKDCCERLKNAGAELDGHEHIAKLMAACNWKAELLPDTDHMCRVWCDTCSVDMCTPLDETLHTHHPFCEAVEHNLLRSRMRVLGILIHDDDETDFQTQPTAPVVDHVMTDV